MRRFRLTRRAMVLPVAIALAGASVLGGCSMIGRGKPETTGKTNTASADAIDVRRYIGPDYCPELRVYEGAQLIRTYERGHQGDENFIIWQASMAKSARECLYDQAGGLTLKIGVSGRVVVGPKGGPGPVKVPVKIAVVKHKEAVLGTERLSLDIAIPGQGSTIFSEVREIVVPSPGTHRDYLIYVGFDVEDWDPLKVSGPVIAAVEELVPLPVEEPLPAVPPPPPAPATPKELPTPTGGFVLTQ